MRVFIFRYRQVSAGSILFTGLLCSLFSASAQSDSSRQYSADDQLRNYQLSQLATQRTRDSLKFILRHRLVLGIQCGGMFFPGYVQSAEDTKTHVSIPDNATRWTFHGDYFISNRWAAGLSVTLHTANKTQDVYSDGSNIKVDANGGINYNFLAYGKYFWSGMRRPILRPSLEQENPYVADIDASRQQLNNDNNQRMRAIRLYNVLGIGIDRSLLLRVKGNANLLSHKSYDQTVPLLMAGIGAQSRVAGCLMLDMSVSYLLSAPFDPYMGGLESYSGVSVQCGIGFIINARSGGKK